jgi:hypothetical protein
MGGHYGSIHIRTEDQDKVRAAVENLRHENAKRFYIAPPLNGWVTVFPENNGQDDTVTEALAEKLPDKTIVHCAVYDDDVFAYWLFENGKLSDSYNSCPEYFGDENPPPRGGNAKAFANLLSGQKIKALQKLLDEPRYTFELERQDKFAELVGLPNTAAAYDYIQANDVGKLQQRSKFIHVPDLALERNARKAQQTAEKKELKELTDKRILLVDEAAPKTTNKRSHQGLGWAQNPATSEAIVSWCDLYDDNPTHTTWKRFTAPSWIPSTINLPVAASHNGFQISHSGDRLAICRGSKVHVWDLQKNELAAEHQFVDLVTSVTFGIEDKYLFVTIRGDPKPELHRIALQNGLTNKAIVNDLVHFQRIIPHPDGQFLAAIDNFGILLVIEIESMRIVTQRWIRDRDSLLQYQPFKDVAKEMVEDLSQFMTAEQMQIYRKQSARHFLPAEQIRVGAFDVDGSLLFCGVSGGLRALNWKDVTAGGDMSPIEPLVSVQADVSRYETKSGPSLTRLTYAVVFDAARCRVLFTGIEGKLSYLDLDSRRSGVLMTVPCQHCFIDLALSADRSGLLATAHRFNFKERNKQRPQHFQIWNYQTLCENAGIQF